VKSIGLAQDGDSLWNFVNPLMNNLVTKNGGNIFDYKVCKLSKDSTPDLSVHKLIYMYSISAPSNITLL